MELKGRRIHIVGSADPEADEVKLEYAHALVTAIVDALAAEGAGFLVPFGKEPKLKDRDDGPSIIFDWTTAEAVYKALKAGIATVSSPNGRLINTIATSKTDSHIPATRRPTFDGLRNSDAVAIEFIEPGWSSGAFRRQRQSQLADVLIAISGGEGVEHLALEYSAKGKPVIPIDLQLGASQRDGSGGAARLFARALRQPNDFIRVADGFDAADLLERTRTRDATTPVPQVVDAVMRLLNALLAPQVFYVRLLNDALPEYAAVEDFFRKTVDPFVKSLGYSPLQMGIGKNEFAWLNQAIFDSLHHSSVALVDVTGLRPNCFMELGYALGNRQRVIVTAREGTHLPFDSASLEAYLWKDAGDPDERLGGLRRHWERNIGMPPLVRPKEAR